MSRIALLGAGIALAVATAACGGASVERPIHNAQEIVDDSGMQLRSPAFAHEADIPQRYTCDGADISPPLTVSDVPAEAVTLVVVVDDPDAPRGTWDHWLAYDVPVTSAIPEAVPSLGTPGKNSWGRTGYDGPCPPSGTHRYFFSVYALDVTLGLAPEADKAKVLEAISGHVLDESTIVGLYRR